MTILQRLARRKKKPHDLVSELRRMANAQHDDLSVCAEAADAIERLRADLAEAVEALKPFAAIKNIAHPRYDPTFVMTPFTFEDCEHASTIVEKHK